MKPFRTVTAIEGYTNKPAITWWMFSTEKAPTIKTDKDSTLPKGFPV